MVLDHPEIPLHTNGSENDIRCQVTKRQVSGATKTDTGRDCRDAFLGLGKTCRSSVSRSGTTLAPGSVPPAPRRCPASPTSFAAAASPPKYLPPGVLPRLPAEDGVYIGAASHVGLRYLAEVESAALAAGQTSITMPGNTCTVRISATFLRGSGRAATSIFSSVIRYASRTAPTVQSCGTDSAYSSTAPWASHTRTRNVRSERQEDPAPGCAPVRRQTTPHPQRYRCKSKLRWGAPRSNVAKTRGFLRVVRLGSRAVRQRASDRRP